MDLPKYNGNIHPDEWINDLQTYFNIKQNLINIDIVISLVDSTIKLPTGIDNIEKLRNALKEDISFTVFKNTNKRILQSLKYNPERKGGNTSNFISNFRKLCYNAEINDVEEQKKFLYKSLPNNHFDYISNEFYEKMKNVNSINELIKRFEEIVLEESNLIRNGSIVALKHVATGKYLSSVKNLCYITGSRSQLVFIGSSEPIPNSLWKIEFSGELAAYTDNSIRLRHVKSDTFLGILYCYYDNISGRSIRDYYKSPSTNHTEVSCRSGNDGYYWNGNWKFNHSKLKNYQGYLKSNDIINLNIMRVCDVNGNYIQNGQYEFLRSHDIQFTVENDTFQEVVCHNERLGGNDERMKNVNSINELAKEFEDIVLEESNLIRKESIVALKHIATGKYLSSISNLRYTTGSKSQLVFVGSSEPDPNSLWKISFGSELATYTDTFITLQHVKTNNMFLGINHGYINDYGYYGFCYSKSPSNNHTEVSCDNSNDYRNGYWLNNWKFNYSKVVDHQGYLKSNDIVNLSITKCNINDGRFQDNQVEFLRSHDIQFAIGNDTFQEVVCHDERLGGNDEWCIELIHEVKIF
ncbi:hypothetical protein GLOIN_2v1837314 [Rhizophagus irregularis DAOM 181602=DAOM 197198]|uniref:MIR domain-containing protein n=1 Tax=Rhizophagus irregularis (strain DAOM 181602 / DAOM 197198 / MUCL 43194) TaxID=747089 RepID=A0A2P4QJP1_RHIID|nr:hypothetical protein GLOIN_2v1837314 [Rhizophagus irregularis DAOM 181602=DAOM 197198]POG77826.1 hypothetical protein GLOIN_2v1837314 [Rhizophagus irregularis DAOM 181602=DAOM 197198]|eukprot:XP_025184692.1 hypothetical protein GLOIN_2v1837314 [Rhizophagus irregularis DAOM 181602=DAOM 197198]